MLIDTHAHLNDEVFEGKIEEVIEESKKNDVSLIVCSSSDLEMAQKAVVLAEKFPEIFASIGVHPENPDFNAQDEKKLSKLAKEKKVIAWGEIGLDYHYEGFDKKKQKETFIRQLELADSAGLPVVIHSRDACKDTLDIVKSYKNLIKKSGIFHCFSESRETAKILADMGFYFSFGGIITFQNARESLEVVKFLPQKRVLLETDCPYLAPHPFRGKQNSPAYLKLIAEKMAEIRDCSYQEIARQTTENALRIFPKLIIKN